VEKKPREEDELHRLLELDNFIQPPHFITRQYIRPRNENLPLGEPLPPLTDWQIRHNLNIQSNEFIAHNISEYIIYSSSN